MSDLPAQTPVSTTDLPAAQSGPSWSQRLGSVLIILFCLEVGLFLLVYPWTDSWSDNYFKWAVRGSVQTSWHSFWDNSYVRGCISGMGVVNLWIAVVEVFRMFARRTPTRS
jgi:hypothetical protein